MSGGHRRARTTRSGSARCPAILPALDEAPNEDGLNPNKYFPGWVVFLRDENASTGLPNLNRTARWIHIDEYF